MAQLQNLGKGVFIVTPGEVTPFKVGGTAAGHYTSIFTKQRAEQWELAQQAAAFEIKSEAEAYKVKMEAYAERLKSLDERESVIQKQYAEVKAGHIKAQNAAAIKEGDLKNSSAKQKADWAKAQARVSGSPGTTTVTSRPAVTSTTTTSSGTSSGAASRSVEKALSTPEVSVLFQDISDMNVGEAATTVNDEINAGLLLDANPENMNEIKTRIINEKISQAASKYEVDEDMPPEMALEAARGDVATALEGDPVLVRYLKSSWADTSADAAEPTSRSSQKTSTRVTPAYDTTSSRGSTLHRTYPGLGALPEGDETKISVADVSDELKRLEALQAAVDEERRALGLSPSAPRGGDIIQRARDIAARSFGPTRGTQSGYYQRAALNTLLNLPPDLKDEFVKKFKEWQAGPGRPDVEAPPTAEPVAQSTRERMDEALAGSRALSEALKQPINKGDLQPPPSEQRMLQPVTGDFTKADVSELLKVQREYPEIDIGVKPEAEAAEAAEAESISEPRRSLLESLLHGIKSEPVPATGIEKQRLVEPLTQQGIPNVQNTVIPETMQRGYPREVDGNVVRPLRLDEVHPIETRKPVPHKMSEGNEFILRQKKAMDEAFKDVLPVKEQKPTATNYMQQRIEEGQTLAELPQKLARLRASGIGKTANDIYKINGHEGFKKSWEEITIAFADDKEKMKTAHNILIAIDTYETNKTRPKE